MTVMYQQRAVISPDVLVNEVGGEAVLLHLKSERYFGMDGVGTQMWKTLTTAASVEAAYHSLLNEFDVEPERLHQDFNHWIERLLELEFIELRDA